jgi:Flp pilus assembly protein TadD
MFSSDGKLVATAEQRGDGTRGKVAVWDASTGELVLPEVRLPGGAPEIAFDTAGSRLVVVDDLKAVRAWSLEPECRPLAALERLAVALGEASLDERGNLMRAEDDSFLRSAGYLRATFPEYFRPSDDGGRAWHDRQARETEAAGDWFAAAWHLSRLLDLGEKTAAVYSRRAMARARLGEVDGAKADCQQVMKLDPSRGAEWENLGTCFASDGRYEAAAEAFTRAIAHGVRNVWVWNVRALLAVERGDAGAYRATCEEMARRFGTATDPEPIRVIAVAVSMAPDALPDLSALTRRMREITAATPRVGFWRGLGWLHFRARDYAAAVNALEKAAAIDKGSGNAWTGLVLAMALDHVGRKDEARTCFQKAVVWLDVNLSRHNWNDRLHLQLLRREAEALLQAAAKDDKK